MNARIRIASSVVGLAASSALLPPPHVTPIAHAQEHPAGLRPYVGHAVRFGITPPVRDLPPEAAIKPEDIVGEIFIKDVPNKVIRREAAGVEGSADPVVQTAPPAVAAIPAPTATFEGLSSVGNISLFGSTVLPPDTVGDVGPSHYVQMVNLAWQVFDKSTGAGLLPGGPLKLSSLFSALGPANPCTPTNDGDPIVLYDELADRWLLSQFCVSVANPNNHQLIAISQTGDPTGAYFVYDFMMPNNKFNDYPKFGVWSDAYYMTDNQFNQAGTAFLGGGAFAFDRARMLAGDPHRGLHLLRSLRPRPQPWAACSRRTSTA